MLYSPEKYKINLPNLNDEFYKLEGLLEDKEAKLTLIKFLRQNIGLTTYLLSGIRLYPYQELIIKAFLNRNFSMLVAGRGGAKCLRYDQNQILLEEKNGLISINKLIPNIDFNNGEHWVDIDTINLWNGTDWKPVNKVLIQPNIKTRKIFTKYGYDLHGSINHLVKVPKLETGEIIWKRYSDLVIGDYVCIDRNIVSVNNNNYDQKEIDESYLIGLLIGDGSFNKYSKHISFCSNDKEILDFIKQYPSGKIISNKKSNCKNINLQTAFSINLYQKYNLTQCYSYDKYIPSYIFKNQSLLKSCLQGLFDTDGTVSKEKLLVSFCTTSKVLSKQVHLSLLTFGIISSLKQIKTKSDFGLAYKINIYGEQCIKFNNLIGFRLSRKSKILNDFINLNKKYNTNSDILPNIHEYIRYIKNQYKLHDENSLLWHNTLKKKNNKNNFSYNHFKKCIDFFINLKIDDNYIKNLTDIYQKNFFFDQIIKIEDSVNNCIDFNVPDGECYWSNGFSSHNTTIAAIYAFLQVVFEPNTTILIAGPTFRTSRFIFEKIESVVDSKEGRLLMQCFGHKARRADLFEWKLNNGSSIKAIPLNGEKIRGFRANVLIIDEFLLLPEQLIKTVLMPFLIAPQDIGERIKVRKIEDELIAMGKMTESQRKKFKSNTKLIALSSASYTFENLYKTYTDWISKIYADSGKEYSNIVEDELKEAYRDATYFVGQLSYEALPDDMVDKSIINEAKSNNSEAIFDREYRAQFTDGSASYFSAKKMAENTIPFGQFPHILATGDDNKSYILSIDPSFSNSPESDFFAMSVFELDTERESAVLVHSYAKAGQDLKNNIAYFHYLLTSFNIVLIISDNADGNFIQAANESKLFKDSNLEIGFFEFDGGAEGKEYEEQLKFAKNTYNLTANKIAFKQDFGKDSFIRRSNELLQTNIDKGKILFASAINGNDNAQDKILGGNLDLEKIGEKTLVDFIDSLDINLQGTKDEAALIEVKINPQGNQTFDLPQNLKRQRGPNRVRRDRYTALLLGSWGLKCYFDIKSTNIIKTFETFTPFVIR